MSESKLANLTKNFKPGPRLLYVVVPAILLLAMLAVLLFNNMLALERATGRAERVLIESAMEQAVTLNAILDGQYETLETFAVGVSTMEKIDRATILKRMNATLSYSSFLHLIYVAPDGTAFSEAGDVLNMANRSYFKRGMTGVRAITKVVSQVNGEARIVLTVPIKNSDGRVTGLILGSYEENMLANLLVSKAYQGEAYSCIYNTDGDYVIGTNSPNLKLGTGSLFEEFSKIEFIYGSSSQAVRANLFEGTGGSLAYRTNDGSERFAIYVPLSITSTTGKKWFLFNVVPREIITAEARESTTKSAILFVVVALLVAATMYIIFIRERHVAADIVADHEKLRIREEQFRIAATIGNRSVGRYDIATGTYYCYTEDDPFSQTVGQVVEDMPQSLIKAGIVDSTCVDGVINYFERIKRGEDKCSSDAALRVSDGRYRWFQSNATVIRDSHGDPSQAIIVFTDITDQREQELAYAKWQQSMKDRNPSEYTLFRCNLSRDSSFDTREGELLIVMFDPNIKTFNGHTKEYVLSCVHEDDAAEYMAFMNSEILLAKYYRGVRTSFLEYREKLPDDSVRWLRVTAELVQVPDGDDIEAFLLYENIDEVKRAEIRAKTQAELDPLTGVLNRASFIDKVKASLEEMKEGNQSALLMVDIDGFKNLNDRLGHAAGDAALVEITSTLRSVLRRDDLIGRIGGDEFLVFLSNIPYTAVIEKKARQMCEFLRKAYSDDVYISASIGVALAPDSGKDFGVLYKNADAALHHVKQNGRDDIAFFGENISVGGDEEPKVVFSDAYSPKRRMIIIDDDEMSRAMLAELFKDEFTVETIKDGRMGLLRLRRFGMGISVVLLDLLMPEIDGFAVLENMSKSEESASIPVVVVSSDDDPETRVRIIEQGASDLVTKPVDPKILRACVKSAVMRSERDRQRAQNSYLQLQHAEELKYRTVIESSGTIVIEYDWVNGVFVYDRSISQHIAGNFDHRRLWHILLSDRVAAALDTKNMQDMVHSMAKDLNAMSGTMNIQLMTPSQKMHWFRFNAFKQKGDRGLTERIILTFNDIEDEIAAKEKLRVQAERNDLTGLYNRRAFLSIAANMIADHEPGYYTMGAFDIDNFKVINDQYGTEKGDRILKFLADVADRNMALIGGLCAHFSADNFAILFPSANKQTGIIEELRYYDLAEDLFNVPLSISAGRYVISDLDMDVSAMYDRAYIAKRSVKGRYDSHVAYFDESMREGLLREQELVDEMRPALAKGEFEIWLQPQYNHSTGALLGAEALVRWRHPTKGLITPGQFIGVFEENGFVYELDKYVWEVSCATLRRWLDAGRSPLPISVNVSRYDIFRPDLLQVITGLTKKYDIPADLLRIEVTETAFAKSTEQIVNVVKELVKHEYTIEIDDFGSGYSSLNTLKSVPADVIKLDMRFLEDSDDISARGGNILESIVRMAKWLNMSVIAEGVETKEQADYLRSIGCNYIQGYYYAKPMPVSEYEILEADSGKELALGEVKTVDNMNNYAFWDPKSMETLVFNSFVGGACILEYYKGRVDMLRANNKYAEVLGSNITVEEALKIDWMSHLDDETKKMMLAAIDRSAETREEENMELLFHDIPNCPKETWLRCSMRVIASMEDRNLVYCSNENITAQREAERREKEVATQIETILENVEGGVSAVVINDDGSPRFVYANDKYHTMFGYSTLEELNADFGNVFYLVHPDDRERIRAVVTEVLKTGGSSTYNYRVIARGGKLLYLCCNATVISLAGISDKVLLSVATDITSETLANKAALDAANQIQLLMADTPGGFARKQIMPDGKVRTLYANDSYCNMLGMTNQEAIAEDNGDVMDEIHPDDREGVREALLAEGTIQHGKYRRRRKDGSYIWVDAVSRMSVNDKGEQFLNVYYTDLTEKEQHDLELREKLPIMLSAMFDSANDLSFIKDGDLNYVCCSRSFATLVGLKDPSEIVGKTDYDIFNKELAELYRADDRRLIEGGVSLVDYVEKIPSEDGVQHYSSTSKYLLHGPDGNFIGLYGTGRDITEHQAALERLKELEEKEKKKKEEK